MEIYLPIAEMTVNIALIFAMGASVGFLSGMFGVGGGFLITPLLIFSGIPSAVAVATVAAQVLASSTSGALSYWRRRSLDVRLGLVLSIAGSVGSLSGVYVFKVLQQLGQLDLIIALSYVTFLSVVGGLMLNESVRAMISRRTGQQMSVKRPGQHNWIHKLPLKMRFKRSKLYVSAIPVVVLGGSIGFLGALLGIGGGFMLVPAMIYLLRVPTTVVIGTSLFNIVITMSVATVSHAVTNQSVDIVLALSLMLGGVIGAQFGAEAGQKMRGEQLRALLAVIILAVGVRFMYDLVTVPDELYSITQIGGAQ